MLKVNPKELGRLRKFRNALLKRMRDPFYLASIILIVIGVVILNYSYLEPKPFNDYVEDNVYHVNINNSSVFYASGFAVGGQFHSNISFINPNGTEFSFANFRSFILVEVLYDSLPIAKITPPITKGVPISSNNKMLECLVTYHSRSITVMFRFLADVFITRLKTSGAP